MIPELETQIAELAKRCPKTKLARADLHTCTVELPAGLTGTVNVAIPRDGTRPRHFLLEVYDSPVRIESAVPIETYADANCDGLGPGDYYAGPNPRSGLANENISLADSERRKQANRQFLKRLHETLSAMQKHYR